MMLIRLQIQHTQMLPTNANPQRGSRRKHPESNRTACERPPALTTPDAIASAMLTTVKSTFYGMLQSTLYNSQPAPPLRLLDFNGQINFAETVPNGLEIAYQSSGRAYATLDAQPARIEVDGVVESLSAIEDSGRFLLTLPKGQHVVRISLIWP